MPTSSGFGAPWHAPRPTRLTSSCFRRWRRRDTRRATCSLHPRFVDANLDLLERVATLSTGRLAILIGFVDRNPSSQGKPLLNAVALCRSGRVVERRYKSLLPTYDVFDEDRYFEPARAVSPMAALDGARLGVTICEDVWNDRDVLPRNLYHRDPVCELVRAGADLLINISASPFTLDKVDERRRLIERDAVEHGRYFFYLNQVGGNDELVFDGHSIGLDPDGREVLRAAEFAEDVVTIDVPTGGERAGAATPLSPILRPVAQSCRGGRVSRPRAGPRATTPASADSRAPWSGCQAVSTRR